MIFWFLCAFIWFKNMKKMLLQMTSGFLQLESTIPTILSFTSFGRDREWFIGQMGDQLGKHFELTFHNICPKNKIPVFADFVNPYRIYEDLQDIPALRKFLEVQMEEYNVSPGVVKMDLVLFEDAMEHICRIERVVSQPRGNMLLVGIGIKKMIFLIHQLNCGLGGSGRQSLSRIASYICEYSTFQISVTRSYKAPEFREDLKTLFSITGVDNRATTFLFNDTQITDESFLEIINNMLSSGEVANLYKPDEFEDVSYILH
jgi:dynein heavy chain